MICGAAAHPAFICRCGFAPGRDGKQGLVAQLLEGIGTLFGHLRRGGGIKGCGNGGMEKHKAATWGISSQTGNAREQRHYWDPGGLELWQRSLGGLLVGKSCPPGGVVAREGWRVVLLFGGPGTILLNY